VAEQPLHAVNRQHLDELTGELGIWQHAFGTVPDRRSGMCTDDVARALTVDLLHAREVGWESVRHSAWRSLRFLRDAWSPTAARFRNVRSAEGAWLDAEGTEDTQGRAVLALGVALAEPLEPAFAADTLMLFANALPTARRLGSLRAIASCIVGCTAALTGDALGHELRGVAAAALRDLTGRLRGAFPTGGAAAEWPWPEPILAYENALLPRALMVAGSWLGDAEAAALGLRVLEWLTVVQRAASGGYSPIGNRGWWRRDGTRARFDQQPIEAASQLLACEAAFALASDPHWLACAERAYGWFLGDNDSRLPVADPATGGCHDGLEPTRVNLNQGAESTLMWLTALEHMRAMRRAGSVPVASAASATPPTSSASHPRRLTP
jgi:hypothetical protein